MRKKSIAFGIVLILLAVYLIVSRLGFAPALPFFTVVFTLLFAYTAIKGFMRLCFTEAFLSIALLGCIHDKALQIEAITPWTLLLAGLLLGIAFDLIFKNVKAKRRHKNKDGFSFEWNAGAESEIENGIDGQEVHVENNFGAKSKYVNSDSFSKAYIENNFGECNVYFNNAILASDRAEIYAENNFGQTNIFLPRTWRVQVREDSAFGGIHVQGQGSKEAGAPVVELRLSCNFGELNVYFE